MLTGSPIYQFGTLKRIRLHVNGFHIKGVSGERVVLWSDVQEVAVKWEHSVTNVFAHNHTLTLSFCLIDGTRFEEDWIPGSIYVDTKSRKIRKLLEVMSSLGVSLVKSE